MRTRTPVGSGRRHAAVILVATVSAVALGVLSGCTATKPKRMFVQTEWARTLRELGIVPVFPPREDVFVGDVYAFPYDPDSQAIEDIFFADWDKLTPTQQRDRLKIGMSPRLGRLNVNTLISQEYQDTISAPATTAEYNGILGNPAFEASSQKVGELEKKLADMSKDKEVAAKAVTNGEEAVLQARRKREAEELKVQKANADLTAAKAVPIDVTAEKNAVEIANAKKIAADDRMVAARRAFEDAPADQKEAAQRAQLEATRAQEDVNREVERAQAALVKRQAEEIDTTAQEAALKDANLKLDEAKAAETAATQAKEDAQRNQAALTESQAKPLTELTSQLEAAKALRTAIGQAGAKMLYGQPRDAKRNVYTGNDIKSGTTSDDVAGSRETRLRLVGFPEFSASSFSQGDLAALVPVEALGLGLNVSRTNIKQISVKIPAAESYGLSSAILLAKVVKRGADSKGFEAWLLDPEFKSYLDAAVATTGNLGKTEGRIHFRVIAEVFYARAMDVSIYAANSFGMRTQVADPTARIGAQRRGEQESGVPMMSATPISAAGVESTTLAGQLSSLEGRLGTTQTVPGGSIQLVNASDSAVGVRRVFDRPIAVGYRALSVTYDLADGKVLGVGIATGTAPAILPP